MDSHLLLEVNFADLESNTHNERKVQISFIDFFGFRPTDTSTWLTRDTLKRHSNWLVRVGHHISLFAQPIFTIDEKQIFYIRERMFHFFQFSVGIFLPSAVWQGTSLVQQYRMLSHLLNQWLAYCTIYAVVYSTVDLFNITIKIWLVLSI